MKASLEEIKKLFLVVLKQKLPPKLFDTIADIKITANNLTLTVTIILKSEELILDTMSTQNNLENAFETLRILTVNKISVGIINQNFMCQPLSIACLCSRDLEITDYDNNK